MSTFIQLTNKILDRFNEVELTTSTFPNAIGFYAQAKEAVNAAVQDILRPYQKWPFLHQPFTVIIGSTPGVYKYNLSGLLNPTDWDTFQLVRNDAATPPTAQKSLQRRDYNEHMQYQFPLDAQAQSTQWNQPNYIVQSLDGLSLLVSPFPDQVYTLSYEAWVIPTDMVNATDICVIPDQFMHIIIDTSMEYAHLFRENLDAVQLLKGDNDKKAKEMVRLAIPQDPYMKIPLVNRAQPLVGPTRRW